MNWPFLRHCLAAWPVVRTGRTPGDHRGRQQQRPRCSMRIIAMLWTGRSCRRRQCWLWRKRKRDTAPASAPKLRQNRFKYRPKTFGSTYFGKSGQLERENYDSNALTLVRIRNALFPSVVRPFWPGSALFECRLNF
jgi:hypothetical protein